MVRYTNDLTGVEADLLTGFFEGWPNPPSAATLLRILKGSTTRVLAIDFNAEASDPTVVGFVTAISDGVLSASIPLLEVRPQWRRCGIGRTLVRTVLEELGDLYMIDLVCDETVQAFYESLDFIPARAMVLRRYDSQRKYLAGSSIKDYKLFFTHSLARL